MAAVWAAGPDPIMQRRVRMACLRSSMAEEEERDLEEEDGVERETGGKRERDFLRRDRNSEQRDPVIWRFFLCAFWSFGAKRGILVLHCRV